VVGYAGIIITGMSPLTRLAKKTVETYVREGKVPHLPAELTPEMKEKAGVFVSIHKKGELRGCIGTFEPTRQNVAEEIITNAISSATQDPRFPPITSIELKDLDYSVDVLTRPEPVKGKEQLDAKKYGVIVQCGWRRGLLLPDLEGVDSVEQQINICCLKGEDFMTILSKTREPLVVMAKGGFMKPNYQYLTAYKGLIFFTKSPTQLMLPSVELIVSKQIWIPG
jgi:AmmeMemoRadiSam system protein A